MKTTLHYQVKDFKKFVLDNLERRGYILASGCEPEMSNLDDMDDPEQVVMEVLVEDRPSNDFNQVEITPEKPSALPEPVSEIETTPTPKVKKTEEQKAKDREYKREWQQKKRAEQSHAREVVAQATGQKPTYNNTTHAERITTRQQVVEQRVREEESASKIDADFQKEVLGEIEVLRRWQEVVAPAPLPFHFDDNEDPAEELASLAGA